VLPLYLENKEELVQRLRGMYAFVISDSKTGEFLAARDPIGTLNYLSHWNISLPISNS